MIFEEAATRENIASGDKLSVVLGKIRKFFTDLKDIAFTGKFEDLIDVPIKVTEDGSDSFALLGKREKSIALKNNCK